MLSNLSAFADVLLACVPFVVTVLVITALLWAATKLPVTSAKMTEYGDRLFGTDEEYDEKHQTGYQQNAFHRPVKPLNRYI